MSASRLVLLQAAVLAACGPGAGGGTGKDGTPPLDGSIVGDGLPGTLDEGPPAPDADGLADGLAVADAGILTDGPPAADASPMGDLPPLPDAHVDERYAITIDDSLPACRGTLLPKTHFTICHDSDWKTARWVSYLLRAEDLEGTQARTNDYRSDPALPVGERAELIDYRGSGYDRSHLAPADDFTRSRAAMSETFLLSNMAPQLPGLNRGQWQFLERYVRSVTRAAGLAKVVIGNLTLSEDRVPIAPSNRIGPDGVAVPTHCWKAFVIQYPDGMGTVLAFILPNRRVDDWRTFQVPVDEVEQLARVDLFAELPDDVEADVEAAMPELP